MKKILPLLLAVFALAGCIKTSDVHIDPGQIAGCMAECLLDTLWVEADGVVFPIVPGEYTEWIFKAGD